jgi:hypothetical protein
MQLKRLEKTVHFRGSPPIVSHRVATRMGANPLVSHWDLTYCVLPDMEEGR